MNQIKKSPINNQLFLKIKLSKMRKLRSNSKLNKVFDWKSANLCSQIHWFLSHVLSPFNFSQLRAKITKKSQKMTKNVTTEVKSKSSNKHMFISHHVSRYETATQKKSAPSVLVRHKTWRHRVSVYLVFLLCRFLNSQIIWFQNLNTKTH